MARFTLDDLREPGFSSDRPEEWASTKKAEAVRQRLIKDGKIGRLDMKMIAEDEEKDLNALAAEITEYIASSGNKTFMLGEPATLTVKKSDGGFSKRPHIGGEDFKITGVYAGKRNALIFMFKPTDVAEYVVMEMSSTDAKHYFNGFKEFIKDSAKGGFDNALREIKKGLADKAELEKNVSKFEQYADMGFGSF